MTRLVGATSHERVASGCVRDRIKQVMDLDTAMHDRLLHAGW